MRLPCQRLCVHSSLLGYDCPKDSVAGNNELDDLEKVVGNPTHPSIDRHSRRPCVLMLVNRIRVVRSLNNGVEIQVDIPGRGHDGFQLNDRESI